MSSDWLLPPSYISIRTYRCMGTSTANDPGKVSISLGKYTGSGKLYSTCAVNPSKAPSTLKWAEDFAGYSNDKYPEVCVRAYPFDGFFGKAAEYL